MSSSTQSHSVVVLSPTLASQLNDPSLLTDWDPSITDKTQFFHVYDPAAISSSTQQTSLARVPSLHDIVPETLVTSHRALETQWRDATTAAHRASLLTAWSRLMLQPGILHDLAVIMTMESGKPLAESRGEVRYAASFLDYFAAEATRSTNAGGGFLVPTPFTQGIHDASPRGQILARHEAVGLCAMITPWNFPSAMLTRKVGPALAAGCTAVIKPSELTPLSAIALCTLAYRAGISRDVVQLITSSTDHTLSVGNTFCQHELVKKISFTGSTNVGKWLLKKSASSVKRVSLELGGNAPFIVFADADLEQAASAAVASKFRNAGQTCVCADRFLIQSSIYDAFLDKLLEKTRALRVGNGMDESTTVGPLISPKAVAMVDGKVKQAIDMGSTLHLGGRALSELGPNFFEPTILSNVPLDADIWKTETFGPVIAIHVFETDDDAVTIANDSSVGLAAYFCTKDLGRAFRVAERLEYGIVGVNEGIISTCTAPFGGIKESGLGREGNSMGLSEYLETKYIYINY